MGHSFSGKRRKTAIPGQFWLRLRTSFHQQAAEIKDSSAWIVSSPNGLANGEEVRSRVDQWRGVLRCDPANRDAGNFEHARPPAEDGWIRTIGRRLGLGGIESAECDIVGSRLPGVHREMPAVVTGDADLRGRSEKRPRLAHVAVLLAKVHPIGSDPLRQAHAVFVDECDIRIGADSLQRLGQTRLRVLGHVFDPQLECRDRFIVGDGPEPIGKRPVDLLRRDQIKATGLRPLRRRKL